MQKLHTYTEGHPPFKYPFDGRLQIRGVMTEDESRNPAMFDPDGEECLLVFKNGSTTGLTLGRSTGIESFVREYDEHGIRSTSMEIPVYPYSHEDGAFSAPGDSGSIVVDGLGRIVGMLTGGTGKNDSMDVTYLTPYYWIEERIKEAFPDSHLYPITDID